MKQPTLKSKKASDALTALAGCATALLLATNAFATNPTTVGVINPNAITNGLTVQNSPNNTGNANFLTASAMSSLMATDFANDRGGRDEF